MKKETPKSKWAKKEAKAKPKPKKKVKKITIRKDKVTFGKELQKTPYEFFIYARVSKKDIGETNEALGVTPKTKEHQKESSLKSQVEFMLGIAKREGLSVRPENIIKENESGKKGATREQFDEMMKKIEKDAKDHENDIKRRKYGGILFWKIDRLARNFEDFARLDKLMDLGYRFISGTETIENTYTGRLLFRILGGFAIYESEKLSARITFSIIKNLLAKKFGSLGGNIVNFGYKIDKENKTIIINEEESKIIKIIYETYLKNATLIRDGSILGADAYDLTLLELKKKHHKKLEHYIKNKKLDTTPIKFIKNILKNNHKLTYNGFFEFEVDVKDEIIVSLIKSIKENDEAYENMLMKGEGLIGESITFKFYFSELEIIDPPKYRLVQEYIRKEEESHKKTIKIGDDKKDEAFFHSILYFQNQYAIREGNIYYKPKKETRHYRVESDLEEDEKGERKNEEISERKVECALRENNLLNDIKKLGEKKYEKMLVGLLRKRQNIYEIKDMTKNIARVRAYEMLLDRFKNKRKAIKPTNLKELKEYDAKISNTNDLLEIARKNLRKTEEINNEIRNNFKEIIKPELYTEKNKLGGREVEITRDEKKRILKGLGYKFMIEKITVNKDKNTIEVQFYKEISRILGLPSPIAKIELTKA